MALWLFRITNTAQISLDVGTFRDYRYVAVDI
jgi:hypothetical protein